MEEAILGFWKERLNLERGHFLLRDAREPQGGVSDMLE